MYPDGWVYFRVTTAQMILTYVKIELSAMMKARTEELLFVEQVTYYWAIWLDRMISTKTYYAAFDYYQIVTRYIFNNQSAVFWQNSSDCKMLIIVVIVGNILLTKQRYLNIFSLYPKMIFLLIVYMFYWKKCL